MRQCDNVDVVALRLLRKAAQAHVLDPESGEQILSCTIIVCDANEWMAKYHDRMPVILEAKHFDAWLSGTLGSEALKCAAETTVREWPVSRRVNRTGEGDNDPGIIEAVQTSDAIGSI